MTSAAEHSGAGQSRGQKRRVRPLVGSVRRVAQSLLSLEQRFLSPLLGSVRGKDVLDVGCGTGRWLQRLSESPPRTLTGIDFSPEMLDRAKQKLGRRARARGGQRNLVARCEFICRCGAGVVSLRATLPIWTPSRMSFGALCEPGGKIYISDVHPETAVACGWKRGFRNGRRQIELITHQLFAVANSVVISPRWIRSHVPVGARVRTA